MPENHPADLRDARALFDGEVVKKLFNLAATYIQKHPELTDRLLNLLFKKIFPDTPEVFGAGESVPPKLQEFGAACDKIVTEYGGAGKSASPSAQAGK